MCISALHESNGRARGCRHEHNAVASGKNQELCHSQLIFRDSLDFTAPALLSKLNMIASYKMIFDRAAISTQYSASYH